MKEIIKFYNAGCGNCKAMQPAIDQLKAEYTDIKFTDIDADNSPEKVAEFSVSALPTLIFLKDGKYADKLSGLKPKSLIVKKIVEVF